MAQFFLESESDGASLPFPFLPLITLFSCFTLHAFLCLLVQPFSSFFCLPLLQKLIQPGLPFMNISIIVPLTTSFPSVLFFFAPSVISSSFFVSAFFSDFFFPFSLSSSSFSSLPKFAVSLLANPDLFPCFFSLSVCFFPGVSFPSESSFDLFRGLESSPVRSSGTPDFFLSSRTKLEILSSMRFLKKDLYVFSYLDYHLEPSAFLACLLKSNQTCSHNHG